MKYRTPERLGISLPLLGFGGMRLPQKDGEIDYTESKAMLDHAMAQGVNYFDTAYGYLDGKSETFFRDALKGYPRESFLLADKLPQWMVESLEDVDRLLEEQLVKTGQDFFDFYLVHAIGKASFDKMDGLGVFELLRERQKEGKFRFLGFSFHDTPEVLREIVEAWRPDFVQIQLNYLDWQVQDAKQSYEILTERGIPAIIMEPVRGGFLHNLPAHCAAQIAAVSGGTNASLALRWIAELPNAAVILSGMSDMDQLLDNIATLSDPKPLTEREHGAVNSVVEQLTAQDTVPCTGCAYCMDCPSGVNIPEVFSRYNLMIQKPDEEEDARKLYMELPDDRRAKSCISCELCVDKCPQKIAIPQRMAAVSLKMRDY